MPRAVVVEVRERRRREREVGRLKCMVVVFVGGWWFVMVFLCSWMQERFGVQDVAGQLKF